MAFSLDKGLGRFRYLASGPGSPWGEVGPSTSYLVLANVKPGIEPSMKRITLIVVVVEVALAAVGLLGGWWIGTPVLENVRVDVRSGIVALSAALPIVVFVLWSMRSKLPQLSGLRSQVLEVIIPLFSGCSPIEILVVSIMAGIGEEIFFRGFLQVSLGRVVGPWIALVLASVLFSLAHYVSFRYAIFAGLIGLYLGTLLLLTGNLFVAMAVHALFDFAALLHISRMTLPPAAGKESSEGDMSRPHP